MSLADVARAVVAGRLDGEALRGALVAELERTGTTRGALTGFDLPPELRANRERLVDFDEAMTPAPRGPWERRTLAAGLVPVFMFAASLEARLRAVDARAAASSRAA
jgi:hypothetical protein